jgi:hypothetical protein
MVGLLLRDTVIPVLVAEVPVPRLSALGEEPDAGAATAMLIPDAVVAAETLTDVGLVPPLVPGLAVLVVLEEVEPPPQPASRSIKASKRDANLTTSSPRCGFDAEPPIGGCCRGGSTGRALSVLRLTCAVNCEGPASREIYRAKLDPSTEIPSSLDLPASCYTPLQTWRLPEHILNA